MKVTYDTTNTGGSAVVLSDLGDFEILGESVERVPADAPLREQHTLRLLLKFFETTYQANAAAVATVRAAIARQQGLLTVEHVGGTQFVDREVTVLGDTEPEGDRAPLAGTSRQSILLTFAWTVHLTNAQGAAFTASYQRAGAGGSAADLGAVERWAESVTVERFDPQKAARRRVQGAVQASGWLRVDTALAVAARQAALVAAKEALLTEIRGASEGTLILGSAFNRVVRVEQFNADVNQAQQRVDWSLRVQWTDYPDPTSYAVIEFAVSTAEHYRDGSADLSLSGRVQAASLAAAQARLAALQASYQTAEWALVDTQVSDTYGVSESASSGDGTTWIAQTFQWQWRRIGTLKPTFQRPGRTVLNLGAVERWAERYSAQLADDLRDQRRRALGVIEAGGWLPGTADVLTESQLQALKTQVMTELATGSNGTLTYGDFTQSVRVLDFSAEVNQPKHRIEWRLTATWTRFPSEVNYAVVDLTVQDFTDHATGQAGKRLSGRIGAPTADAARAKLAAVRTQFATQSGTAYTLAREDAVERRVDADTDGQTFIELTFNDEWLRATGDIVHYTLRMGESDELTSGWVRQTWSGTVTARGASQSAAYAAAAAQAATLGGGKGAFLLSATLRHATPQLQTALNEAGSVIQNAASPACLVTVEFDYEYKVKGSRVYLEYTVAFSGEEFGRTTESVNGYVTAPTLADARSAYEAIKSAWASLLLLNENSSEARQKVAGTEYVDRLNFAFAVHRPKTAVTATYTVSTETDWLALTRNTTVRGNVWGATKELCVGYADALGTLLGLGNRVQSSRNDSRQTGRTLQGAAATAVFVGLDFSDTYTQALTGYDGVVECSVEEDITHSGTRWIEKPLPDSASLWQSVGITPAQRIVSGTVKSVNRETCREWASRCRRLLLVGPNGKEHAPQMRWGYTFARLVSGYPVADGGTAANVQCHTLSFTFRESLSTLAWSA